MIEPISGAPAAHKTPVLITINGVTYSMKYGALAQYVVSNLRVPIEHFFSGLRDRNSALFSQFIQFFAAMVAHNFTAMKQEIPSPEYWMGLVDDDDAKVAEICDKVGQVLRSKIEASLEKVRLQEAAPAQGPILN